MTVMAPLIVERSTWEAYATSRVEPAQWSAIIPAAGKGSRLGFDYPKILFLPVAGRSILQWLLDLLLPNCKTAIFVLSPVGRADVEPELDRLARGRYKVAIQEAPSGMGDAVEVGAKHVVTEHAVVIWGDQWPSGLRWSTQFCGSINKVWTSLFPPYCVRIPTPISPVTNTGLSKRSSKEEKVTKCPLSEKATQVCLAYAQICCASC